MNPEGGSRLSEQAISEFQKLRDPEYGLSAGWPWFYGLFGRDVLIFAKLTLSRPQNLVIPGLVSGVVEALDRLEQKQATDFAPERDAEPGKLPHQWMNSNTPQHVMDRLKESNWPIYLNDDGHDELVVYAAGDVPGLYPTGVLYTARVLQILADSDQSGLDYMARKWKSVKAAHYYQTTLADKNGDGLCDTTPQNPFTIKFQTQRDGGTVYLLEDGSEPYPPYTHLSNNSFRSEGFESVAKMAVLMGEPDLAKEAFEARALSKARIQERFWITEWGYPAALIYGEAKRADFISSEAIDGMWCNVWTDDQNRQIVDRLKQPDMMTPYGPRGKSMLSKQFHFNGPKSYWDNVWTHEVGIYAQALRQNGFIAESSAMALSAIKIAESEGFVELISVDAKGRIHKYEENGEAKACNPQLWAIGAILACLPDTSLTTRPAKELVLATI